MPDDLGDCPCEDCEVEGSCPGKLQDDEILARIIHRDLVLKNGSIRKEALIIKHFLEDGWSFVRRDHADMEHAMKRHVQYDGSHKKYCYANIKTSDMRALRNEEGRRQVCVIANPQKNNPEHALAHNKTRGFTRSEAMEVRADLLDLLKKFDKVSNGE